MGSVVLARNGFVLDGRDQVLLVGSLFYFRIPRAAWRDRMEKMKLAGYHALDVYFPWNYHEPSPGEWDFSGERDADAFLSLAEETGLYVTARPGPYICSEWDGGGLPAWLFAQGMRIRDNDPTYLEYVRRWFDKILPIIGAHSHQRGGCVISMQLENELDFFSDVQDRHGYIGALRRMAMENGIDVPLVCCAGQSGLNASGGLEPGVHPAMNFYPAANDALFGERVKFYQSWLWERGYPLLVTETNRDHHFLRFLLLLGARLLGPYNQCGGTDFGFTSAVNNWGKPLSFQTSDYDFASMIAPSGEYRRQMLLEARLLRGIIDSVPGLAKARPAPLPQGFSAPEGVSVAALALPEGGLIAGGMQCGPEAAQARWPEGGYPVVFQPGRCAFLMSHVSLEPMGMQGEITFASAVPVCMEKGRLVFAAEQPGSLVVLSGKRLPLKEGETFETNGIRVTLLSWEEAANPGLDEKASQPVALPFSFKCADALTPFEALPTRPLAEGCLSLEANGVYRGYGLYQAEVPCGGLCGLLLTQAADLVTVRLGEENLGTNCPGGYPLYLPAKGFSGTQPLRLLAEVWGHSNFDDQRVPSMRIKSLRGVGAISAVASVTPIPLWLRACGAAGSCPQLTALGGWLTTDAPALGTFTTLQKAQGKARFLHFPGLEAQAEIIVNGRPAGTADALNPWLDLSGLDAQDGLLRIECRVTQRDYTQPCGIPVLYQGDWVRGVTLKALGEKELAQALSGLIGDDALTLPVKLGGSQAAAIHGIIPGVDCEIKLSGHGIKATVLRGGRVCGRLILDAPACPLMAGGRPDTAFLPSAWGDDLVLWLEPVAEAASLDSIALHTLGTFLP